MVEFEEVDYAAIITVELPGMDRPATVTLTLKPPDAVEVAPGEVKPLRDCTLADLQAFADALEANLWEQYQTMTLSELAATERAQLKITILGEAGKPLSPAQKQWLEQATAADEDGEEGAAVENKGAAQEAAQEAAQKAETEEDPETDDEPPGEEDASAGLPADAGQGLADGDEKPADASTGAESGGAEAEAEAPTDVQMAAPTPVETPVVEGAEPTMAPVAASPSEGDVRVAGLRRPVGHRTPAAVDILINEPAFREAQEHAVSSLDREVAGMLVGPQPEKQPDGRYVVHITDVIPAQHTRMSGASVTYTPESWRYVTDVLDERYPDGEALIVGWYHTHPGFGIFLSSMDLFIHQNFFTQSWHVALVLDPQAGRSGFFCWNRQQSAVQPYDFPWPRWAAGSW